MTKPASPDQGGSDGRRLKDILDKLVVDCGEEYLKLHTDVQDFNLTNSRMDYYENKAIKQIISLFPATEIVEVPMAEPRSGDYDRGYNSGYIAGKRSKVNDLPRLRRRRLPRRMEHQPERSHNHHRWVHIRKGKKIMSKWKDFVGPPLHEFPHAAAMIATVEFWIIMLLLGIIVGLLT